MANPTNADIIGEIRSNHAEVTTRLKAVEDQVKKTNGRVTALETFKTSLEAVDDYKAKQPIVNNAEKVEVKSVWWSDGGQKLFLAAAAVLLAVSAYIAARGGN